MQAKGRTGALTSAQEEPSPRTSHPWLGLLATAAVVVALDQLTKTWALDALASGPIDVVEGVLRFRLTFNAGGAFGLLQGFPELFLVASVLVVAFILVWARRLPDKRLVVPLGLVAGGGIGNLVDRLFRAHDGRVVDFVDLHVWPVFNVADSAIVLGVLAILILGLRRPAGEP